MDTFGDQTLPIGFEWPTTEHLKQLPLDKHIKLNQIAFKKYKDDESSWNHFLTGLQLGFTNNVKSILLESKQGKKDHLNLVEVDVSRKICKVSMNVWKGQYLCKLKLIDDKGENIVNLTWYNAPGSV